MENWEADSRGERLIPTKPILPDATFKEYMPHSGFDVSYTLPFEHLQEIDFYRWFMPDNWKLCFWSSAIYMVVIFCGRKIMENRPRYQLQTPLILWNMGLAIFSIVGAIRMNQEMFYVVNKYGLQYSICVPSYCHSPTGFWVAAFILSKIIELGDTVFIVLRKQNLIFLHWYHHIATLIYTWLAYSERSSAGRWFITVNITIHAFMYSYYACRAMRVRIPRVVNIVITTAQTLQMAVGMAVNYGAYSAKRRGESCHHSYGNIVLSILMYFSYFILFSWYFYNAYIKPKPKSQPKSVSNGHKTNKHANGLTNGYANGIKKYD